MELCTSRICRCPRTNQATNHYDLHSTEYGVYSPRVQNLCGHSTYESTPHSSAASAHIAICTLHFCNLNAGPRLSDLQSHPLAVRLQDRHSPHCLSPSSRLAFLSCFSAIRCLPRLISHPVLSLLLVDVTLLPNPVFCSSLALQHIHLVNVQQHLGMEKIRIPSPSKILDLPNTPAATARGKSASPPKRAKQIATATQKPKQTKSRNGTILRSRLVLVTGNNQQQPPIWRRADAHLQFLSCWAHTLT